MQRLRFPGGAAAGLPPRRSVRACALQHVHTSRTAFTSCAWPISNRLGAGGGRLCILDPLHLVQRSGSSTVAAAAAPSSSKGSGSTDTGATSSTHSTATTDKTEAQREAEYNEKYVPPPAPPPPTWFRPPPKTPPGERLIRDPDGSVRSFDPGVAGAEAAAAAGEYASNYEYWYHSYSEHGPWPEADEDEQPDAESATAARLEAASERQWPQRDDSVWMQIDDDVQPDDAAAAAAAQARYDVDGDVQTEFTLQEAQEHMMRKARPLATCAVSACCVLFPLNLLTHLRAEAVVTMQLLAARGVGAQTEMCHTCSV